MKTKLTILLASLLAASAFAGTVEYSNRSNQVDGILSKNMLRTLISNSAKLQAKEYEHDKVVSQVPVELLLATAIESEASLSNSCSFIQRSRRIQCVLTIKSGHDLSEVIYTGYATHEDGARIQSVISKTL